MARDPYPPFDLSRVRTYSLRDRPSKVSVADFARPPRRGASFAEFLASLPDALGARDLRRLAAHVVEARRRGRPVVLGMGAHVLKVGLSPVVIHLLETGAVTALAMNGAGIVHDFEIAYAGATSEDVDAVLGDGAFGMAEETGRLINQAIAEGVRQDLGLGRAVGAFLNRLKPSYLALSVVAAADRLDLPVTVHVALGTDIVHMHASASGADIGEASHRDFRVFTSVVADLDGGGVYLNVGSAVLLPEVFLKAVTLVRNRGVRLEGLVTANLDFLQHYRPLTNVVRRPVAGVGTGYSITGHHEILLPLLAFAIEEARCER
jgi:hypothetical protein